MTTTKEPEGYVLDELRESARQRLVAKRDFVRHLIVFIVVNGLVVATWMSTGGGYFWPAWLIGLWGIGVLFHGWDVWRPITTRDVEAELFRRGDQKRP